jgi:hypothetical protein
MLSRLGLRPFIERRLRQAKLRRIRVIRSGEEVAAPGIGQNFMLQLRSEFQGCQKTNYQKTNLSC